ncbi:MAG: efflux transporter permease subunit [Xanthobacteraceae bacterium]|nr:efflux transporter permease subunit [Xanthobacteraceae bacterium]
MNGISSWSIRNPVPTLVLFIVLTLAGLVGYGKLRQNNTPDMDIPTIIVTVTQPGAAPSELETQVARIVEDAVAGLGNVEHIRSTLVEGAATITIEFALGIDVDRATNDVRNAVSAITGDLPADADEPIVQRLDATDNAILTFVVDAPEMTPDEVSWFVDNDVAKAVLSVKGVSKISRAGGVDKEIRVRLDPDRLLALGATATEVSQKLKTLNLDQPGGRATLGAGEQTVRTLGSMASLDELAATAIPLADGRVVRLSELGRVESSWAEPRQRARLDGREVIGFSVYRSVGSSEVDVAHAARAKVAALAASHPGVTITEVTSSTDWVEEGFDAAIEALWLGALLAVFVVWLFLRDWRATLISSAALPLSLIPTFALMQWLDQSLNNITLLAIALVVGILVDDAIVEIENIVRHMRQAGKTAYEAAIEAADEIGLAVVATTFTIVAVFGPVAFMAGIPGQFFRAFAIAVCGSVLFSLLVARMLTPLMAAYLMKAAGHEEDEPFWVPTYLRLLGAALRHRWTTLALGLAFFAASVSLIPLIPTDFMPAADRGRSSLSIELPPGATLDDTDRAVLRATAILRTHPEVASVYAAIGTETTSGRMSASSSGEVRSATVTVTLTPPAERGLSQQQFEAKAGPELRSIPGARVQFGADGQSGAKVEVALVSDDPAALSRTVDSLLRDMRGVVGLANPASTSSLTQPELHIAPKPDKAAALGITTATIAETADIATLGDVDSRLPKFDLADRQISIRVMLEESARSHLARLASLPVTNGTITVPLSAVADIGFGSGPSQITRLDRSRTASIEAELVGITVGQADAMVGELPTIKNLPKGVSRRAAGDIERMEELFASFGLAIGSGIVLMYLVLVLLFGDFLQPLTILTALPLSIGGALGFLLLTGHSFSMPALIGVLMLMGIAAKNSILLVEYAIAARADIALPRMDALMDAARKRARPIVMTTIAMVLGMLPIALGYGADAETRAPMAIAVIGGLVSSTLLSLLYVPAAFCVVDDLSQWVHARMRGRSAKA